MAKKEKLNVKVVTAPNGYALDIGCHGFFYFTIEELLKGFIYHVGFKELGEVSMDKISGIVGAAASWKDNAEVMEQVIALEHER